MAFPDDWGYRKSHVVNQQASAGINYHAGIKVYFGAGADGTEVIDWYTVGKVYCDGLCNADFSDIRFTASDGTTELKYAEVEIVNDNYAIFWVKLTDNLTDGNSTIYIYYGNSVAVSTSDWDNTFIFSHDFEDDLAKWAVTGACSCSTDQPFHLAKGLKGALSSSHIHQNVDIGMPWSNVAMHVKYYDPMAGTKEKHIFNGVGTTQAFYVGVDEDLNASYYIYRIGSNTRSIGLARSIGWHNFYITQDGITKKARVDNALGAFTHAEAVNGIGLGSWWTNNTTIFYYDCVFVRKFVDPEPTHGAWGAEESLIKIMYNSSIVPLMQVLDMI